jgi:hypothetical protein
MKKVRSGPKISCRYVVIMAWRGDFSISTGRLMFQKGLSGGGEVGRWGGGGRLAF